MLAVGNEDKAVHEFFIEPAGKVDAPLEAEVNGEDRESEFKDIASGETAEPDWKKVGEMTCRARSSAPRKSSGVRLTSNLRRRSVIDADPSTRSRQSPAPYRDQPLCSHSQR
jgi:hypothetical protein